MVNNEHGMPRRRYLKTLSGVGTVALTGHVGRADNRSNTVSQGEPYEIGVVHFGMDSSLALVMARTAQWYAEGTDKINVTIRNGERNPTKQIEDANFLIQQGVDALAMVPFDSNALAKPVNQAAERGIPTFSVNIGVFTDMVKTYNAVGQASGGTRAGERMVEALEARYGEPRGKVGILTQVLEYNNVIERTEGFQQVMAEYDNIEVVQTLQTKPSTRAKALEQSTNFLRANPDIDGMFYVWGAGGAGLMAALQRLNRWHEKGSDDHVIVTGIDGSPELLDAVENGFIDYIADQPVHWEYPLAFTIAEKYLDAGKDDAALPQVGDTIQTDYITVPDKTVQHSELGELPVWQEPTWGPSEVINFQDYAPWVKEKWTDVTEENADSAVHWENISATL